MQCREPNKATSYTEAEEYSTLQRNPKIQTLLPSVPVLPQVSEENAFIQVCILEVFLGFSSSGTWAFKWFLDTSKIYFCVSAVCQVYAITCLKENWGEKSLCKSKWFSLALFSYLIH